MTALFPGWLGAGHASSGKLKIQAPERPFPAELGVTSLWSTPPLSFDPAPVIEPSKQSILDSLPKVEMQHRIMTRTIEHKTLKPFWRYYGGKYRAAPRYPEPKHKTIIEPFAGAAGYSTRYPDRNVILVEKYPVIAEMWRYLISVTPEDIRRIPEVEHVDDLPGWVPEGGRSLVGFWMNAVCVQPCKSLSAGCKKLREMGRKTQGWCDASRERIASQVGRIRHWRVIEGEWYDAPIEKATYFVDPPYNNKAGAHYKHGPAGVDYKQLAAMCQVWPGQVIACENAGATWLPFEPFGEVKAAMGRVSREVVWVRG